MRILALSVAGWAAALTLSAPVSAASLTYRPIAPTMENRTVVLTGKDLTIDQRPGNGSPRGSASRALHSRNEANKRD